MIKRGIIVISNSLLVSILFFSSCNPRTSSDADTLPKDSVTIERGRTSFAGKCASCHNFEQDGIGPQLAGITSQHPVEWIRNFIRNPKQVIDSGDSTAQNLFERFKAVMPSFDYLSNEEIIALIAYLNTQQKPERQLVEVDTNDLKNPIPDTIQTSDLVVGVEYVTKIFPTSTELPLTRITKLDYEPGKGDLYIVDLRGKLYKLVNGQPQVYMDMAALNPKFINQPGMATGFGSFAFHPEFAKNGLLYTAHSEAAGSARADFSYPDSIPVALQWILTEWKTDASAFPFSGKGREIFRIDMPTGIHGVQEVAFNPFAKPGDGDYGLLYIGIGDGGSTEIGVPLVSPKPERVWGSIIRIDPFGHNGLNGNYGIPIHNPFAKTGSTPGAREIFAWGFRNPHRFSWTKSGELLAVNVGEHNIEALNMIIPGQFYGWPIREGTFMERFFNNVGKVYPLPPNDSIYHITYPVAQFDHDDGTAITGGFEYTGKQVPQLTGKYVFGDIGSGKLFYVKTGDLRLGKQATIKKWNISIDGSPTTLARLCGNTRVELRFAKDKNGELYLLTKEDGKIYKLVKPKIGVVGPVK